MKIQKNSSQNKLYYGDNLRILRNEIPTESVDLIYLDPPFNSNRNYNVLFREESGKDSEAQITAFEDTWHWNQVTAQAYDEIVTTAPNEIATMIEAMKAFVGSNQMMAYLVMMTIRLIELHRVLKRTGSLYLHCDPTASHYLKILLDTIFGAENFKNEIIWKRASSHNDPKKYGNIHDCLLYYSKTKKYVWNKQYTPYSQEYIDAEWRQLPSGRMYKAENMLDPQNKMEEYEFMGTSARWRTNRDGMMKLWNASQTEVPNSHGRIKLGKNGLPVKRCRIIFLDEMLGVPLQTLWNDIPYIAGKAAEKLGYPTQKPVALIERILLASSSEGDTVLDPFCGCGTTIAAAQKLNRNWIGIDITHLAIALQKYRLRDSHQLKENEAYTVIGEPTDLPGARQLAQENRYQFQWWALSLVQAVPMGSSFGSKVGKKGADRGIDGVINFSEFGKDHRKVLIQVKSGKVKSGDIRDLRGTMEREKAAISVFITLEKPSSQMLSEAYEAGFYQSFAGSTKYPKIQIISIEDLLHGAEIKMPPRLHNNFKAAQRVSEPVKQVQPKLYE